MADGKYLTELTYEVDVLRKAVETILDDKAGINWGEDGTLCYFDYEDGWPADYWLEDHEPPHDNREEYTSLGRFLARLKKYAPDSHTLYLLESPVWRVIEDKDENQIASLNALLGDLEINLDDSEMNMGDLEMDLDATPSRSERRTTGKVIDFQTRKPLELEGPDTEQKEMDEYQREQAAHRLIIPPYPNLCMHCGDPIESDDAVHPECIKGYEDYWDEREKELERRATRSLNTSLLTLTIGEASNKQQVYRDIPLSEILRTIPSLRPYAGTLQQHGCLEVEIDGIKYGVYPF